MNSSLLSTFLHATNLKYSTAEHKTYGHKIFCIFLYCSHLLKHFAYITARVGFFKETKKSFENASDINVTPLIKEPVAQSQLHLRGPPSGRLASLILVSPTSAL